MSASSEADRVDYVKTKTRVTPQQFAQKQKMGRGWAVTRNSATLATTNYEHIADEIVTALNAKFQEESK